MARGYSHYFPDPDRNEPDTLVTINDDKSVTIEIDGKRKALTVQQSNELVCLLARLTL